MGEDRGDAVVAGPDGAAAKNAGREPGGKPSSGEPGPAGREPAEDGNVTEEEALRALSGTAAIHDERRRAASIVDELVRMLDSAGTGFRIGSINVFDDKVEIAEGDLTIGAGRAAAPTRPGPTGMPLALDAADVQSRTATYVRPAGFERAKTILDRQHLLVLCGPRGTGREAAALALLAETAGHRQLFLMGGSALLADHGWRCGPPGTCFSVTLLDAAVAGQLDDIWLEQTAKRLLDAGNFMVVVTGSPTAGLARADRRADFSVEDLGAPDAMTVLARRVKAAIDPARAAELKTVLGRPEISNIIRTDGSPATAVRVARVIAAAFNEHRDIDRAISALGNPAAQVQAWFDRYDGDLDVDYGQLVLPIAVSVLEDSSYLTVTDAAVRLYSGLFPARKEPPPLRFRRALREHQQWIQVIPSTVEGMAAAEILKFRSPLLRAAVLRHTWTCLDGIRPALSTWLDELAMHPAVDVRARAAASAGLLASMDFSYVLSQFLHPWASSRSFWARDCAALALTVPGRDEQYEDQVWELLRRWATHAPQGTGSQLAATAAEAAGSVLGRHRPSDALDVLHEVLKRDEWYSLTAVALAVLNLAENGCTGEVLTALADWSEPNDGSSPVIKALAAFAIIARAPAAGGSTARPMAGSGPGKRHRSGIRGASRLTGTALAARPVAGGRPEASLAGERKQTSALDRTDDASFPGDKKAAARPWPVFFTEAGRYPDAVRDLWGRALSAKPTRPLALDALHYWLELADEDHTALATVGRVIQAVSELGGKHPARIDYYLDLWAHDPKKPLRAAQRFLS